MRLELLLAHADDRAPVLREGLRVEALQGAPQPAPLEFPERLWDELGDQEVLPRQRWGLVVPEGRAGDELLARVAPLRRAREEEQGGEPARIYRVKPDMDGPAAARWKKRVFRAEDVPESERPRYLLLLGDLDQVSFELQQVLATDAYVGRLAFTLLEGYDSYVEKVLRWERAPARRVQPRLLFYTARDGSRATELGHQVLVEPGIEGCRRRQQKNLFPQAHLVELTGEEGGPAAQLLEYTAEHTPSVLFSMSHGLGLPEGAQADQARRRELQGALLLPGKQLLTGAELAARPFLPGGAWFCFACFSAGTPARSAYTPWLQQLSKIDEAARQLLGSGLLAEGQRPFVSSLSQAALANPEGPLAVVGHVDLAWAFSFNDQGRGTPSRFFGVLETLAEGRRAGTAVHKLLRLMNETNDELAWLYHTEERARQGARPCHVDELERARLWMLRHDLAGYALLGDPAARLPLIAR